MPQVFERLHAAGLTSLGGCGDTVRAITGCPAVGVDADELFDVTPVLDEAHRFFTGNPDYVDLPRKHKISISACASRCNAPEINCISLVGVLRDGEPGFGVLVGGGLSSVPRSRPRARGVRPAGRGDPGAARPARHVARRPPLARVAREVAHEVHGRRARAGGVRAEVERRLGYELPSFALPPIEVEPDDHLGIREQPQGGLASIGVPVHVGLLGGERLVALGDLLEPLGADARVTRQQNLLLAERPAR